MPSSFQLIQQIQNGTNVADLSCGVGRRCTGFGASLAVIRIEILKLLPPVTRRKIIMIIFLFYKNNRRSKYQSECGFENLGFYWDSSTIESIHIF